MHSSPVAKSAFECLAFSNKKHFFYSRNCKMRFSMRTQNRLMFSGNLSHRGALRHLTSSVINPLMAKDTMRIKHSNQRLLINRTQEQLKELKLYLLKCQDGIFTRRAQSNTEELIFKSNAQRSNIWSSFLLLSTQYLVTCLLYSYQTQCRGSLNIVNYPY